MVRFLRSAVRQFTREVQHLLVDTPLFACYTSDSFICAQPKNLHLISHFAALDAKLGVAWRRIDAS